MKIKLISLLIFLSLSFQIAASPMADLTARDLYLTCKSDNKIIYSVCITYLFTTVDTENIIANLINAIPKICMPDDYKASDFIYAFTTFLDIYPQYADNIANWVIIGAFKQLFPCEENLNKKEHNNIEILI